MTRVSPEPHDLLATLDGPGDRVTKVAEMLRGLAPELAARHEALRRYGPVRPRPEDGRDVAVSPPGFCWSPVRAARTYRLQVWDAGGRLVHEHRTTDPVHQPAVVLPAGSYEWDVTGLDEDGGEIAGRGRWRFTIVDDAHHLPRPDTADLIAEIPVEHPRFLFGQSDLDAIRADLDTTRSRNWTACRRAADAARDLRPPQFPRYDLIEDAAQARLEAQRYVVEFEAALDRAFLDLCIGYLVTRDERYVVPAKEVLIAVASWPSGEGDISSLDSPFGDGVALSISRCLHRGYDWLHDALDHAERDLVRSACVARARQIHRRLVRRDFLAAPGESHNGRMVVYLAEMAIVLAHEDTGAEQWLDYSLEALGTFYPHWGGDDGGWSEGPAYAMWYAHMALPGLEALARATGYDLLAKPFFRAWAGFFIQCTALRGDISPFGDGAELVGPGNDQERGYGLLLWYFAHRFRDGHAGWWAGEVSGGGGFAGELALLFEDEPPVADPSDIPDAGAFRQTGWVGLHGDIADPQRDAFLLLRSSPYGSVSHGHADQNAFALFKGGDALLIPSGQIGPVAGAPHHARWTRTTRANNTVLVDGEGQAVADPSATGRIASFESHPGWSYAACDAADAYGGRLVRFTRHVLQVRPDVFVLVDELIAPSPATFSWLLHSPTRMAVHSSGAVITAIRGRATVDVHLRATSPFLVEQTSAFGVPPEAGLPEKYRPNAPAQWHLRVENEVRTESLRVAACMVTRNVGHPVAVSVVDDDGWFGVEVDGVVAEVALTLDSDHENAPPRFRGRAADGTPFERHGAGTRRGGAR